MKRENKITFRVSDYEKNDTYQSQKIKNQSIGFFADITPWAKRYVTLMGLDQCSCELNKIDSNINQIAVLCHQRAVQNPNLDEICKQLCEVVERIYSVLRRGDSQAYDALQEYYWYAHKHRQADRK